MLSPVRGDVPLWLHGQAKPRSEAERCGAAFPLFRRHRLEQRSSCPSWILSSSRPCRCECPTTAATAYKCTPFFMLCVCAHLFVCVCGWEHLRGICSHGHSASWVFSEEATWKYANNKFENNSAAEKGLLWVCAHHFNLTATRVSPIHLPPLSDNAQSKTCTMVAICAITDPTLTVSQQHGLIRYISCMWRGQGEWAQADWIAASVSPHSTRGATSPSPH